MGTKSESTRQIKVGRQVQKDVSEIIQHNDLELPGNTMVTVTRVRVTPDLSIAKVYLSVFPSNKQEEVRNELELKKAQVRYSLGNRVRHQLRIVPELHFFIDDSLDYIDNIENLLDK